MKHSAGILLFRHRAGELEVFLVHPGGPFWARKDAGAWSVPKGEYTSDEAPLDAARREFQEELGAPALGPFLPLGEIRQPVKIVTAWACEQDFDPALLKSNLCQMEWPPHSGVLRQFPEVDRGEWFRLPAAHEKIHPAQRAFLVRLQSVISSAT
ncbi:MAG: NUDIX domain-containing protein [Candidatus Solibacter sp.]